MTTTAHQTALPISAAGLVPVPLHEANALLDRWGHYLGPVNRPFGSQSWVLEVDGAPVSVAVGASIVSATIPYKDVITVDDDVIVQTLHLARGEVVELARLCSSERWATRVMLRLWREVAAPRWPYWPTTAAVAYPQNGRHDGSIYRFDGWTKVSDRAGSNGGGTWSRKRATNDVTHGRKTLWIHRYPTPRQTLFSSEGATT